MGGEHGGNVSAMENVWLSHKWRRWRTSSVLCAIGFRWQISHRGSIVLARNIVEDRGFEEDLFGLAMDWNEILRKKNGRRRKNGAR